MTARHADAFASEEKAEHEWPVHRDFTRAMPTNAKAHAAKAHVEGSGTGAKARNRGEAVVDQLKRKAPWALNFEMESPK